MHSREKILQAIRDGKPAFQPLPPPAHHASGYPDAIEQFSTVLGAIGGRVVRVDSLAGVAAYLEAHFDLRQPVVSLVAGLPVGNVSPLPTDDPHAFEHLYLAVLESNLGVAENGAVWVDEGRLPLRALPFITLYLAVVLREDQLVGNLHEAYATLDFRAGYGVFIAGPSKTADIEQSLVIGAHGPKSMTVFLVRS
jgi:L-lactate dehydrogenase complex protein LldG